MPELPEVEAVVRSLRPRVRGRRLGKSLVSWPRTLGGMTRSAFARSIDGARVRDVRRRAKWIVFDLVRGGKDAGVLCVHLRMTGRLQVDPAGEPLGAWERVRIALDDGRVLRFVDPRKFGRMVFARDAGAVLDGLGPEPLEVHFTRDWLAAALRPRRRALKPLLLDQTFVAGLGNIYVDETLHRARLHPLLPAERLRGAQVEALWRAIRDVLSLAIERADSNFRVYGRKGEPCDRCATAIRRVLVGRRATYYCPKCQRKETR